MRALARNPELNVVVFALLLNFPWEILQASLFAGMGEAPHAVAIKACSQATFGDAVIMLFAYWSVSVLARSRNWIRAPSGRQLSWLVAIGVVVTVVIEWLATRGHWIGSWTYGKEMPVLPGLGIGLSPLIQWLVLPLLVVYLVCRQTGGRQ